MKLYVYNLLVASNAYTGGITSSGDLVIGNIFNNFAADPYEGSIDDIRIYNRVLTASEIQALYDE